MRTKRHTVARSWLGLCLLLAGFAAGAAQHNVVTEEVRAQPGGHTLQVLVAQGEIKSDINASNMTAGAGGGLLFALIDAGVNSSRSKKAEEAIQPLRTALAGYDFDGLALQTSKAIAADVPWLGAQTVAFGKDSSIVGRLALLDAAPTEQTAFFEYTYDASADFSAAIVSLSMQFANKTPPPGKKPDVRLAAKYLPYVQTVTCVVPLPAAGDDTAANIQRWTADDGKLARKALDQSLTELHALAVQALSLTVDDAKTMGAKDKKFVTLAGRSGRVQEETTARTLLFNGELTSVRNAQD